MQKVVLITGASSGIGKEAARLLAQSGFRVYGAARRLEQMQDLTESGVRLLKMDVTDEPSMVAGVQEILNAEKRIDVLVNKAGYGSYGSVEDVPLSEARYQFEVNIFGLTRLCQLVLPAMRAQRSGRIINISSIGGSFGEPHGAWYHATKFALEGLSDSLRMELKQFNIDVVVIKPGAIVTEWNTIARDNLAKVSGKTVYGNLVMKHVKLMERADQQMGSRPEVVAKAIKKAIVASRPRTRYAVGGGAGLVLFMRRILSDRMFDRMYLSLLR